MRNSTSIIRKTDELGRIVLPIEIRQSLSIDEHEPLEILIDQDLEQIILQKTLRPLCLNCQSTEHLKEIKPGYYICHNCVQGLK